MRASNTPVSLGIELSRLIESAKSPESLGISRLAPFRRALADLRLIKGRKGRQRIE